MAKKITIEYDIDSKDVKIAGDETLALTQQLRILKKELQRADLKPEQFDILRKKVGEVEDNIAKTTVRSKDFFGVISTLPGPIGQFGGSLLAVVDTLKIFAGFSFKDIKNSLGDLGDDVVEITNGFLGLNKSTEDLGKAAANAADSTDNLNKTTTTSVESTSKLVNASNAAGGAVAVQTENINKLKKAFIDANPPYQQQIDANKKATTAAENAANAAKKEGQAIGQLTVANETATVATNTQTAATNALTFAQRAATFAANALKIALASIGIGLIIIAVTELISLLGEWVSGTKAAEKAQKDFNNELERTTTLLDLDLADTRRRNAIRIAELKSTGATEKQIRNQQLKELKENLDLVNQAVIDAAALENKTLKRTDEKSVEDLQVITKKRTELEQKAKDIRTQIRVAELTGIAEDNKKRLELSKEESNRRLKELEALIQLEIEKDNTNKKILQTYLDERRDIIKKNEKLTQAEVRLLESQNSKRIEDALNEDANRFLEYLRKIEDLRIGAIEDEEQSRLESIANKLYFDKIALSKDKEFIKAGEEEKAQLLKNLEIASQKEVLKVREEFFLRKFTQTQQQNAAEVELATRLKEQEEQVNNVRIQNAGDLTAVYGDYFFGNKGLLALYNQYFIDLRQVYTDEFNANEELFDAEQVQLDTALESKRLSQEKYDEQVRLLNEKRLQNNQQFTERQIQLDQLEVDSKRASADKTVEIGFQLVNLLSAVAGKSKGIQIAAALTEAGVAIARIIIDTQRAIIAFSASVAPLGPAGVPIAAGYAVKAKIAAALSIGTIIAQGIGKLKEIKSQGSEEAGGGAQSNQLGRGYEKGGMIKGRRHAQGGTMIEAEDGEAVMTRGAVTLFRPMLSMMNQMGGGTSFTPNLMTTSFDNPIVAKPAEEDTQMIIKTYVVESDLTNIQQRQARLKDLSTL